MRENEPVLLVLSVCDGKIILEKGEILYEKCHVFRSIASFTQALDEFDILVVASINAHIMHFERAWKASRHDGEIPPGFVFEAYTDVADPYRLCQIRVGPRHGFRALVIFLDNSPEAYWIYVYKKVRDRQPDDMKRARIVAQRLWDELQKKDTHGTR